jgi:hypothetical protein
MRRLELAVCGCAVLTVLAGCAQRPMGPTVAVMPAPNKPLEVFQQDQAICTQYADQQVSGAAQAANNQAVGGALLGTALGAGLGAAIGGGHGAAIGAAGGALVGTGVGVGQTQGAQYGIQRRYDIAYSQCMYSRGNQVPEYRAAYRPPPAYGPPAPPDYGPPAYEPAPPPSYRPPDPYPPPPTYSPPQ